MWFITINKSFEVSLAYSEALMHFSESVLSQTLNVVLVQPNIFYEKIELKNGMLACNTCKKETKIAGRYPSTILLFIHYRIRERIL